MDANKYQFPEKVLAVKTHDMKVCIDVACIVKILLLPYLERSPSLSPSLVGMLNYAGQSIPVMDLYTLLAGVRRTPFSLDHALIIVRCNGKTSGLIVDEVCGIEQLTTHSIEGGESFSDPDSLVMASVIINTDLFLLLKPDFLSEKNMASINYHGGQPASDIL